MIERLIGDYLQLVRRGAARATGLGIRTLRRLNAVLDPRTPVEPDALVPDRTVEDLRRLLRSDRGRDDGHDPEPVTEQALRERFQALIERSREPAPPEDEPHPAFPHIVDALSPDEARIVVLLCEAGPQPVVAVRATPLIGRGDQTVLENVSLIGEQAGCHRPQRTPAYIDNLCRLGVAERHGEELVGDEDYDVLSSRPEVAQAEEQIEGERLRRSRVAAGAATGRWPRTTMRPGSTGPPARTGPRPAPRSAARRPTPRAAATPPAARRR